MNHCVAGGARSFDITGDWGMLIGALESGT